MKKVLLDRRTFFQLATVTGASLSPSEGKTIEDKPPSFQALAGTLMTWEGETPPEGWLATDGRALSPTEYPDLFKAVLYHYGREGESFLLPDLRHEPIMGYGGENIPLPKNMHRIILVEDIEAEIKD